MTHLPPVCWGSEIQKGGTRVRAGGVVKTPAAKQAILDTLDPTIASLKNQGTDDKPQRPKPEKKKKDPKDEAVKELQKDIKAFLVSSCKSASSKRLGKYHWENTIENSIYYILYIFVKFETKYLDVSNSSSCPHFIPPRSTQAQGQERQS